MPSKKPIETPEELVHAVEDLLDRALLEDDQEANAFLEENGLDPQLIGNRIQALAHAALADSPLNWRNRAQAEIKQAQERLEKTSNRRGLTRAELLEAIERLRPKIGKSKTAVAFFRNYQELTDAELVAILAELEYLNEKNSNSEQ